MHIKKHDPRASVALAYAFRRFLQKHIHWISVYRGNSNNHHTGHAADFAITSDFDVQTVVEDMIDAGFRGIGVYWNGVAYSFHGDVIPGALRLWRAVKGPDGKWIYGALIGDPKVWPV